MCIRDSPRSADLSHAPLDTATSGCRRRMSHARHGSSSTAAPSASAAHTGRVSRCARPSARTRVSTPSFDPPLTLF
eukprot:1670062-Rhodomonas_salina.4